MEDLLSPIGARNPTTHVLDSAKIGGPPQGKNPNDEIPEDGVEIPLPSKGVFYYPPYRGMETIWVRHLDFRDEDLLTTKEYLDDGSIFDRIVSNVILTKGITAKDLVPIDRDTILLWLRAKAIGEIMDVDYRCPKCESKNVARWNLTKFDIPQYEPEVEKQLLEFGEQKITCPLSGVNVFIKVPAIRNSNDTEKRLKAKKKNDNIKHDLLGTASLMLLVSGVEIEPGKVLRSSTEIMNHFAKIKLPLTDGRYIRKKAEAINLSYDTAQDLYCPTEGCGHIQEGVELPIIHSNFFWPDIEP